MSNSPLPLGIDVSNHQGIINWRQVAEAGVKFAFMKATEGITFKDGYFARNWEDARRYGIARGAYHFGRPAYNQDAREEADHFINTVIELGGPLQVGDMLVLDMEEDGQADYGPWTLYWLQIIESYVGFKPLLYTARNYINTLQLDEPGLANFGLWLASWKEEFPTTPPPWEVTAFWQYSDQGRIPGVRGNCDVNRFNGTVDRIKLYGKPDSVIDPELPFDPNTEVHIQPDDWSCSIETTSWLLRSMGIDTNRQQLQSEMVPNIVHPDEGLRRATGEGLAGYLNQRWSQEIGSPVFFSPVTFDDVWAGAGRNPTAIGGIGWNHWVGVRNQNSDGTLSLANPAPVFKGIGQFITREQWNEQGPFHAVWIDRIGEEKPPASTIDVAAIEQNLNLIDERRLSILSDLQDVDAATSLIRDLIRRP